MINPLFAQVLGSLWTAGHRPDLKEKLRLQEECQRWHFMDSGETEKAAIDILDQAGYSISENPSGLDLLDYAPAIEHAPNAGHVLKTAKIWNCDEVRLAGYPGEGSYTIANLKGRWHARVANGLVTMGSGGPASILAIDTSNFRPTGETQACLQWDFAFLPTAHEGVNWKATVPVWEADEILWLHERAAA